MAGRWVTEVSRRRFLGALGALGGSLLVSRGAQATLARGLTVREIVAASRHVVVATALEAHAEWAELGGRKLIVTDARVRVEETLAREAPAEREIVVRVLGGILGNLGERVDGQAELVLGKPCTLFLTPVSPLLAYVTGAAQGHYPLLADAQAVLRLRPSPHLPTMIKRDQSAVATLSGVTVAEARAVLRGATP